MNSSLTTTDVFLGSVRKSSLIKAEVLDSFLEPFTKSGELPGDPMELARNLMAKGHLTRFQTEQLLQGRYKNFQLAGKYNILERLSTGPMSSVYLCEHETMRRLVAIKLLPAEKAKDSTMLSRFHREARAAARLRHPNVVAVHDLDRAGGLHFLVAEYVDGLDLERIVSATGPMTIDRAADCICQAAEGLQHAHEMGMVHRDIKPGNLLLDRSGTVKLLDLGLARLFLDESDGMTKVDDGKMLLGTIDYLAPEQAIDSHEVDIRADIYSLGATAFFLLSGRTLFNGASTVQKLAMHGHRPPEQIVRELSGIPRGFADILVKMLAKEPKDRYQTPGEVAEAMAPWSSQNLVPPSAEEMPRHCLATRRAVEKMRSATVRVPAKSTSNSVLTIVPKVSKAASSNILLRKQWAAAKGIKKNPRMAIIGLGAGGGLVLLGTLVWALSGSSAAPPASKPLIHSEDSIARVSNPTSPPAPTANGSLRSAKPNPASLSQEQQDEMYNRANELASSNRGVEAGDLLRRLIPIRPQGAWGWQRLALLDLHSNNLEKHRQDCLEMLRIFANTNDANEAERIVKSCLIASKPIELEQVASIADRLLASASGEFAYWSRSVMGLVAIRRGNYDEALSYLTEAEALNTVPQLQARCLNQAFLSILYSRRKEPNLARKHYAVALKIMKDETEKADRVDFSYDWHNWYACGISLNEAENLLKFPPK
jgi:serine/threonine protein kinase